MDMHTPLGRPNNSPESPFDDLDAPLVPLNEGMGRALTLASKKDSFFTPEEAAANAMKEGQENNENAGPQDMRTPPGGKPMIPLEGYQPLTQQMQYSKEGERSYVGAESMGKVIKGDVNQLENYGV